MSESENESDVESQTKGKIFKVNNVPALHAKLAAIQLKLDWVEKLDIAVNVQESEEIVHTTDNSADDKAENDFKREMSFYNQALQAATKAFKRLHKKGITTRRPTDFFAEMAKSDSHMNKVREKLLSKQTAVERRDQVRAIREQKKQGKKIQQQILAERKSEKKKMLNALKKTKKGKMDANALLGSTPAESSKDSSYAGKKDSLFGRKKDSSFSGKKDNSFGGKKDNSFGGKKDNSFGGKKDNSFGGRKDSSFGGKKDGSFGRRKNNFKRREMKNDRYGYGGKKRNSKWNTAESSSSVQKFGDNMKNKGFKAKRFGKARRRRR